MEYGDIRRLKVFSFAIVFTVPSEGVWSLLLRMTENALEQCASARCTKENFSSRYREAIKAISTPWPHSG